MSSKERCPDGADDILKPTQTHDTARNEQVEILKQQLEEEIKKWSRCKCIDCCEATSLGRGALEISRSDTATVKRQQAILRVTLHSRNAAVSRCNQAKTMHEVDTPGSLDMHHPLALSMTPPEPPAVPQTAECGTPSFLPEAGHLPQQSLPSQLPQQLQSVSQNLSETADFEGSAPRPFPRYIEIQPNPQNPQDGSPSKRSSIVKKSSTRVSNPIRPQRSIMKRVVQKIKDTKLDHREFTSSEYPEAMVHLAHARRQPPVEVVFEIVTKFAKNIKRELSYSTEDQLMLYCLCKVLFVMKVEISRLEELGLDLKLELPIETYFKGVEWAIQLLSDLYKKGWDHRAVDLLLSCRSRSQCCMNESC